MVQSAAVNKQHDTSEHGEQLDTAVRRLVAALRPERIYLFGSRARGDADQDSDFDLLVVVPEVVGSPYRLHQRAYDVLWGLGAGLTYRSNQVREERRVTQMRVRYMWTYVR